MNKNENKYTDCLEKANNFNKIAKKYATGHFLDYEGTQESYDFDRTIINYCYRKKTEYIQKAIKIANKNNYVYGKKEDIIYFETKDEKQISFHDYNNIFNDLPVYEKEWIGKKFNNQKLIEEEKTIEYFYNEDIINYSKNEKPIKTFFNFCFNNILKEKCFDNKDLKKYFKGFKANSKYSLFKNGYFLQDQYCDWNKYTSKKELKNKIKKIKEEEKDYEISTYNFKELRINSIQIIENKILIIETNYQEFDDCGDNIIILEL